VSDPVEAVHGGVGAGPGPRVTRRERQFSDVAVVVQRYPADPTVDIDSLSAIT
jgi:hypothetical protein